MTLLEILDNILQCRADWPVARITNARQMTYLRTLDTFGNGILLTRDTNPKSYF